MKRCTEIKLNSMLPEAADVTDPNRIKIFFCWNKTSNQDLVWRNIILEHIQSHTLPY